MDNIDMPILMKNDTNIEVNFNRTNRYTNPNSVYKDLYNSYEKIVEAVEAWFKYGFSTAYSAFDNIMKAKQSNSEAFIKTVMGLNPDTTNFVIPEDLIKIVANNIVEHDFNICGNINHDVMDTNANELGNTLFSIDNSLTSLLKYKVENSYEIRPDLKLNRQLIENTLIFKVRPILTHITNNFSNDMSNLIPMCKYDILFDYISICNYAIYNAKYPESIEEIIDKDIFIETNMTNSKSIINSISRKIILEVFDRINDVYDNFDKFNSKSVTLVKSILKSDYNESLVNKLKYLCKSTLSEELPNDSKYFNDMFNKIEDRNIFVDIYNKYSNSDYVLYDGDIMSAIIENNNSKFDNFDDLLNELCSIYYGFAFSHFFEDEVLYEYCFREKDDILDNAYTFRYTREFDKKYDYQEMINKTTRIDDYNLRDFFQVIIIESKKDNGFCLFDDYIKPNGERDTFLTSKAKRFIAIYELGFVLTIKRLMMYYSLMESKHLKFENYNKLCQKLYVSIANSIRNYANILSTITTDAIIDGIRKVYAMDPICREYSKFGHMIDIICHHLNLIAKPLCRNIPYLDNLKKFFKTNEEYHIHGRYETYNQDQTAIHNSFHKLFYDELFNDY